MRETYTRHELCELCHCSKNTIYKHIRERGFPDHLGQRLGREWLWSKEEVHAWLRIHMPDLLTRREKFIPADPKDEAHWERMIENRRKYEASQQEAARRRAERAAATRRRRRA